MLLFDGIDYRKLPRKIFCSVFAKNMRKTGFIIACRYLATMINFNLNYDFAELSIVSRINPKNYEKLRN